MGKLTAVDRAFANVQYHIELAKQDIDDTVEFAKSLHANGASEVELANLSADIAMLRDHAEWLEGVIQLCPDEE